MLCLNNTIGFEDEDFMAASNSEELVSVCQAMFIFPNYFLGCSLLQLAFPPTVGQRSLFLQVPLVVKVTNTNAAIIIFVYFMVVEDIYCKISQICAKSVFFNEILPKSEEWTVYKLVDKYGEGGKIYQSQLELRAKAQAKLPLMTEHGCFFTRVSLEQSTAQWVAQEKANHFKGTNMLSLCGGLGSDELAFSKRFEFITSIEIDNGLNELVKFNDLFNSNNYSRIEVDVLDFLKENKKLFDLVYIDPDRRAVTGKKSLSPDLYSPDFLLLLKQYKQIAPLWLIKLSPAVDLDWIAKQISWDYRIEIYAIDGEIKEILLVVEDNSKFDILVYECAPQKAFSCSVINKPELELTKTSSENFIEASALAIKSGFSQKWVDWYAFESLNNNSTYFKSTQKLPESLGRNFELIAELEGSLNFIKSELQKMGIKNAVISAREFGLETGLIRKKLNLLEDDGTGYFLFFGLKNGNKICFVTKKWGTVLKK